MALFGCGDVMIYHQRRHCIIKNSYRFPLWRSFLILWDDTTCISPPLQCYHGNPPIMMMVVVLLSQTALGLSPCSFFLIVTDGDSATPSFWSQLSPPPPIPYHPLVAQRPPTTSPSALLFPPPETLLRSLAWPSLLVKSMRSLGAAVIWTEGGGGVQCGGEL